MLFADVVCICYPYAKIQRSRDVLGHTGHIGNDLSMVLMVKIARVVILAPGAQRFLVFFYKASPTPRPNPNTVRPVPSGLSINHSPSRVKHFSWHTGNVRISNHSVLYAKMQRRRATCSAECCKLRQTTQINKKLQFYQFISWWRNRIHI